MQSHHCNRMFAEQAERAHHSNGLQAFLLEWTKQYGLERCIFVLSCTISDRKDDGRFYPPARQATARFANQYAEYDIFEMADLTNGVHSGIINLDGPCRSENEYMKRYSAANYAHRVRVGLER